MEKSSTNSRNEWLLDLKSVGITSGIGCAFICGVFFLAHWVINSFSVGYGTVHMLVLLVGIAGAFLAGYLAARRRKRRGMLLGMMCGLTIFVVMVLSSLMVQGGDMSIQALLKLCTMVIAGALGGVMGVNKQRGHRRSA